MVSLYGNAGDAGVLQGLEGFNCAGEGTGKNLAGVKQIARYQDKIYFFGNGIRHDTAKHTKEVFVAFGFTGGGAVGLTEVDVSSMDEARTCQRLTLLSNRGIRHCG